MVTSILFDFGISSFLLFIAYLLRQKVKVFQRLFLPAPLIAGIIGILLGPYVLGKFSPVYLQYSEFIGQAALPLLCCVFCTQLFMMKLSKDACKKAWHSFSLMSIIIFVQVLIGIWVVRAMMPGANDAYGLMPFTSYLGGPGICAIVSNIVGEQSNFSVETANSIGNTYATISMISGVIIGMTFINIARRKGILAKAGNMSDIPVAEFTGYVEPEDRQPSGYDVTNNNSMSTMTLAFTIAGVIIFVGMVAHKLLIKIPALSGLAVTVPVILAGLLVGAIFKACKWDRFVDMKSVKSFSSIALELMITSTIANTNIAIFSTHGKMMAVTSVLVIVTNIIVIFGLGKLWNRKHWFENSIGVYGLSNGVAATGLLLLRTADTDDVTGALSPFCTAIALIVTTTQLVYLNIVPMWISNSGNAVVRGTIIALVAFVVVGFLVAGKRDKA